MRLELASLSGVLRKGTWGILVERANDLGHFNRAPETLEKLFGVIESTRSNSLGGSCEVKGVKRRSESSASRREPYGFELDNVLWT
jgi:hypothetical protein